MHPTATFIFMCLFALPSSSKANRYDSEGYIVQSSSAQLSPLNLEREGISQQLLLQTLPQSENGPNMFISSRIDSFEPYMFRSSSSQNVNFVDLLPPKALREQNVVSPQEQKSAIPLSLEMQDTRTVWNPPPYQQSLKDYFTAEEEILIHFTEDAYVDIDDKDFRYIVIVHTIDGLSRSVAQNGFNSYNETYNDLVRTLMEEAVVDARGAARQHTCIMDEITRRIAEIRDIIFDPVVRFICDNMDTDTCDAVIYAAVHMRDKYELYQEESALIALGYAASTFLNSYDSVFDAVSEQNVFLYLLNGRDDIWDLVRANAGALHTVFTDGMPLCLQKETGSSKLPVSQANIVF